MLRCVWNMWCRDLSNSVLVVVVMILHTLVGCGDSEPNETDVIEDRQEEVGVLAGEGGQPSAYFLGCDCVNANTLKCLCHCVF